MRTRHPPRRRNAGGRTRRPLARPVTTPVPPKDIESGPPGHGMPTTPVPTNPATAFRNLDDKIPLLLLPVRLETRFVTVEQVKKLRIRIYPDSIHVDAHTPALTETERRDGLAFWKRRSAADATDADRTTAAADLVAQHGARRAGWIARTMRPSSRLDGSLAFPDVEVSDPATTDLSPRAVGLPARFAAIGYIGDEIAFTAWGNPVASDLRFGPSGDWTWMENFDAAKAKGVAIEVDLAQHRDVAAGGVDKLLVVGVSTRGAATDEATLASLLDAHRYTDGLAFVPQGTPTNNTDGASSGWTHDEVDPEAFVAAELGEADADADGADCSAVRLSGALGLVSGALARRLDHAADEEEAEQRAMNRVLWPVTWGQYLDTLVGGVSSNPISSSGRSFAKRWFIDHVRGGAPLPALCIGPQPYGLLPARLTVDRPTSSMTDDVHYLEETLLSLRETWRDSLAAVPRMDPTRGALTGDEAAAAEEDLIAILGALPHAAQLAVRELRDRRELTHEGWKLFLDALSDPNGLYGGLGKVYTDQLHAGRITSLDRQRAAVNDMREQMGDYVPSENRVLCTTALDFMDTMLDWYGERFDPLDDRSIPGLNIAGVQEESVDDPTIYYSTFEDSTTRWTRPLVQAENVQPGARTVDYFAELLSRLPGLEAEPVEGGGVRPRRGHAARRVSPDVATSGVADAGTAVLPGGIEIPTLGTPVPLSDEFNANEPLLYQLLDAAVPLVPMLDRASYRAALERLSELDVPTLELRLRETLGLCANRIDAWITSLARNRLDTLRDEKPTGVQLGAFGWLHDLRPDVAGTSESQGFIHAPSMAHAATAAVLRSGWAARGTDEADSPLAVDLRSDRVRTAAELLDGVRQGQTLGDLLGCRFERRLHDDQLDAYIDPVRRAVLTGQGSSREPRGPVDGLALADLYAAGGLASIIAGATSGEAARVTAALDDIASALDATADATVAESVHQLLGGNLTRASAALDAAGTGANPPPELRSMQTQRAGVGITHRLLVTLGETGPDEGTPWSATPRSTFDPWLERWMRRVLGDPTAIICGATLSSAAGTAPPGVTPVSLADLGMSALDASFEAPLGEAEAASAWSSRVTAYLHARLAADAPDDTTINVDPTAAGVLRAGQISFRDASLLAWSLRSLVASARPVEDVDLVIPGEDAISLPDAAELEARVAVLDAELRARAATLAALVAPGASAELGALHEAMRALAGYALGEVLPTAPPRDTRRDELVAQATRLSDRTTTVIAAIDQARATWSAAPASPDNAERVSRARTVVGLILGERFPVLPRFAPSATATLSAAFLRGGGPQLASDPARATGWLQQVACVRAGARRLDDLLAYGDWIMGAPTSSSCRIAQLPVVDGDPWVAISAPVPDTGGRLALFCIDHGGVESLAAAAPIAGLVLDDWVERIPAREQVTGVAIHFDAPSSRPPQALLLVTPPEGEAWSFELVTDTLLETLEAATLRTIGPERLVALGQHIPAVLPPTNVLS